MKLTFLGTCSGTEPFPGFRHVSFTVESGGGVYFFDAGESCSYTAHLAGIDLLCTRAIFISHTHMDHVAGLPKLLWDMRKLCFVNKPKLPNIEGRTVQVLIPDIRSWHGMAEMLAHTEGDFHLQYFKLDAREYGPGQIYTDGVLRVLAAHNEHLGMPPPGQPWRSFSFRLEAVGEPPVPGRVADVSPAQSSHKHSKSILYSGDIRHISELVPWLDPCDLLLTETGHHRAAEVCAWLADFEKSSGGRIGTVAFIHHGRAMLDDMAGEKVAAEAALGRPVFIATDGATLEL